MSAFDLAADHDSLSLADQARANPLDLSQPVGFFTGAWKGPALGLGGLLTNVQRTTGLALGAVAGSFDMLTGDAIKAQEKVFDHIVTPADKLSRHLAPKPDEIGMAGQWLHGLIKIGGEAVAFGAPGVLALETVGGTLDALDKGVDLQTAAKVGGVQGAAMTAGVIAPMTLGASGLGMNVMYGAGINLAQGVFQRGATSQIYENAGRHDLAMQFKALDGEAMAVDAILGAAFAGGGRALQLRGEKAKADAMAEYKAKISEMLAPEHVDAALVKNEQLKMERSGFGLPADLPSRDAHVANMNGAIEDMMEGRPVTMRQETGDMLPDEAAAKVQADVEAELAPLVEPQRVGAGDTANSAPRVVDVFGNGSRVDHYEPSKGLMFSRQETMPGKYKWTVWETFPDSEGGNQILGDLNAYKSMEEAQSAVRGLRISATAKAKNSAKYGAIPKLWDGEAKKAAKAIIDAGVSVDRFASSTQSKSKYIYTDSGLKIRIADHNLPSSYDAADVDYRFGGDVKALAAEVKAADATKVKGNTAPANSPELGSKAPEGAGMQERPAVRADESGSLAEPAQSDGAGGGGLKNTQDVGAVQLKPDAVIPLDDADATTTVAEAQGIITDLETAAREQETGLRAAVACFLRAA